MPGIRGDENLKPCRRRVVGPFGIGHILLVTNQAVFVATAQSVAAES
jgi:hypothetical protein